MAASTGVPDDAPAWPEDAVEVARIADAWGVKGWIKVQPFAADPQALIASRRWFLKPAEAAGRRPASSADVPRVPALLRIAQARRHGDGVVAQARDIDDRAAAESLKGARVFVSRASFPTAEPDEYYWVDLIGLQVVNLQGEVLGTVTGLLDTGPHSVLRIGPIGPAQPSEDAERLVPFVSAYVVEVKLADKRIVVDWGLDY